MWQVIDIKTREVLHSTPRAEIALFVMNTSNIIYPRRYTTMWVNSNG